MYTSLLLHDKRKTQVFFVYFSLFALFESFGQIVGSGTEREKLSIRSSLYVVPGTVAPAVGSQLPYNGNRNRA